MLQHLAHQRYHAVMHAETLKNIGERLLYNRFTCAYHTFHTMTKYYDDNSLHKVTELHNIEKEHKDHVARVDWFICSSCA